MGDAPGLATGLPHCTGEGSLPCALRIAFLAAFVKLEQTTLRSCFLFPVYWTRAASFEMRPPVIRLSNDRPEVVLGTSKLLTTKDTKLHEGIQSMKSFVILRALCG
jgi:hypothetical protein